jgi:pimeloyl-ACP methyl ester carboxylesterase
LPSAARAALAPARFVPCTIGKAKLPAHCGTVPVYEDRTAGTGRVIRLKVIEVDAMHRSRRAIFWNPGGPGGDDASDVPYIADGDFERELMTLRDRYDLVFVDNRGTGESHQIQCELFPPNHPEYEYARLFPETPLRACRAARARDTDLNMYTTDIAADDLDDVREALHYRKIVLDGGSYGTTFFLDYLRRHPARVESVVLQGVAPPGMLIPLEDAGGAQKAIDDLLADCLADRACHERSPHVAGHFSALVRRFDAGPVTLELRNPVTKREQTVSFTKQVFADRLRQALYANESAAYVPYIIEQAYQHQYGPLERLVDVSTAFGQGLAIGLNLSTTCAEDLAFITEAEVVRSSAGSFEGDARVRAQLEACKIWNVARASSQFVLPVRSRAPVLMISGASDPATPPQYARAALPYLPNARQIVIPHASHDVESNCTDRLIVTFVRTGDTKRLDAEKCIGDSHRPPFATSMKGFGG